MEIKDYHNKLFPYAYNILGSTEDAKDAVQDILVKYLSIKKEHIKNTNAYLVRAVINQAINIKRKNKKIIQDKIWLPEPLATEETDTDMDRNEIISYSMLVLLEKLTPKERAVFILKNAFDYSHKDIAGTLDLSIENSRKLLSRAKSRLAASKAKEKMTPTVQVVPYMENYIDIIKKGDVERLEELLSKDIALMADGGNEIKVVRALTQGIQASLKLLFYVFKTYQTQQTIKISEVNHQPALLYYEGQTLVNCQIFQLEGNKIKGIYAVLDPKKLKTMKL